MLKRIALVFCLLFCLFSSAFATVHEYTLKNGLKLLVKPDTRAPVAIFQIWYRVGGSYEPNGITGISHALEHMMFEGTRLYPNETFSKVVNANGGQLNAFTADDYTAYFEEFAAKKIPLSFKMEADRMRHATLSEKSFKKEIQVVMEERRMRYEDQPMMRTFERLRAAAFLSNPYHHMTIGWMGDLQHMTVQDVRRWYKQWYVPNNATIVVVGDVKPANMLRLAKKYFAAIPARALPYEKPVVNQTSLGEKVVNVLVPAKVAVYMAGYRVPVLNTAKQKWQPYALDALSAVLSGGDSSRFAKNLMRGAEVATSASASYDPTSRLDTIFTISGVPAQGHTVAELRAAIAKQIKMLQSKPIDALELTRIKVQMIAGKIYARDSISAQASELGGLVSVGLPWQLSNSYLDKIEAITPQQIQVVANEYLQADKATIAILHPQTMTASDQLAQQKSAMSKGHGGIS